MNPHTITTISHHLELQLRSNASLPENQRPHSPHPNNLTLTHYHLPHKTWKEDLTDARTKVLVLRLVEFTQRPPTMEAIVTSQWSAKWSVPSKAWHLPPVRATTQLWCQYLHGIGRERHAQPHPHMRVPLVYISTGWLTARG